VVPVDIFTRLEQDHREMTQMLEQLSEKFDERTFKRFSKELASHARAEEKVFYKAIVDKESVHESVLEGYEEHHVADLILRELKSNKHGTERWMAKLSVLKENVEHHIEEEEEEIFPAARSAIDKNRAIEMTSQFETAKKKVPVS
jgi:hemerythrin superfamily protein